MVAIIGNLKAIGIEADAERHRRETYFRTLADGACHFCRAGWYADYPTYDNFMYDLFRSASIGGNNLGSFNDPSSTPWSTEAQAEPDDDEARRTCTSRPRTSC